jgi:hypothetical protein
MNKRNGRDKGAAKCPVTRKRGPQRIYGIAISLPPGMIREPQERIDACLACVLHDCQPASLGCGLRKLREARRGRS